MRKVAAAFAALRYGASLTDPALWKSRQNTINALVGLLGAVVVLFPLGVTEADVQTIAGGLAIGLGLVNTYLTTATTTKIGVGSAVESGDSGSGSD